MSDVGSNPNSSRITRLLPPESVMLTMTEISKLYFFSQSRVVYVLFPPPMTTIFFLPILRFFLNRAMSVLYYRSWVDFERSPFSKILLDFLQGLPQRRRASGFRSYCVDPAGIEPATFRM